MNSEGILWRPCSTAFFLILATAIWVRIRLMALRNPSRLSSVTPVIMAKVFLLLERV